MFMDLLTVFALMFFIGALLCIPEFLIRAYYAILRGGLQKWE